jgi:glycine/D-amino acid oxidase-like deaminating enzyme
VQTVPYWLDYAYDPRPPLAGPIEADACVIGAGVSGLSCARELARRGLDTVVLEARTVASGASGRNGGFLLAGAAPFHVDARERWGREPARRLYARTVEAQREVYALAEELDVADAVRRVGSLRLATSLEEAEHVRRHVEALQEDGFSAELVEREELEPALQGIGHAGCLVDHDGALQPARWIRALATDAERAGARIYESTRGEQGNPVKATHTVIAGDAASAALVPSVKARRLHMIATAPLKEHVVSTLVYARYGYEYFQQTPDGRIALGGFSDLDGESSYTDVEEGNPAVWERLDRYLHDDLGVKQAEITHRWVGIVGFSDGDRPFAGQVEEGVYTLGGYSGTGNLIGFIAGRAVAELIATGESSDLGVLSP